MTILLVIACAIISISVLADFIGKEDEGDKVVWAAMREEYSGKELAKNWFIFRQAHRIID